MNKKILAVIPARAGSKGIPHKNYRPFDGRPLITYAIENALASRNITDIVVTTDDPVIKDIARKYSGVLVVDRPADLSGDKVTLDGVIFHALEWFVKANAPVDYCVTMQPTSPLLSVDTLDEAISAFMSDEVNDATVSVVDDRHLAWGVVRDVPVPKYKARLNRQQMPPEYREAGAFVISKADAVTASSRWKNNRITVSVIPSGEAVDIDTMDDWIAAEALAKSRRCRNAAVSRPEMSNWERVIADGDVYLVAEIGVNYYDIAAKNNISPMAAAKLMVKEAKDAGINAVKFQSYKAGTIASKFAQSYWDLNMNPITSQYELFKMFDHFGESEYAELADYARDIGIDFLSTPFDYASADYLDRMMGIYKISSSDLSNLPFIEYIALKQKPIFISIGASNLDEIEAALAVIRRVNDSPIAILHCVLEYPTPIEHANLEKIRTLKNRYPDLYVGFSDHTIATEDCIAQQTAALLGAQIIEKHFTLDKTLSGNDHLHSMDPADARRIIASFRRAKMLLGNGGLSCLDSELVSRANARRSLVLTRAVKAGEILEESMVTFKRPGTGISPSRKNQVLGRIFKRDLAEDSILTDDDLC